MCSDIGPSPSLNLIADEVHRHGKKWPGADRIIKVPFRTTADRDSFIRSFNAHRDGYFGPGSKRDILHTFCLRHGFIV